MLYFTIISYRHTGFHKGKCCKDAFRYIEITADLGLFDFAFADARCVKSVEGDQLEQNLRYFFVKEESGRKILC